MLGSGGPAPCFGEPGRGAVDGPAGVELCGEGPTDWSVLDLMITGSTARVCRRISANGRRRS